VKIIQPKEQKIFSKLSGTTREERSENFNETSPEINLRNMPEGPNVHCHVRYFEFESVSSDLRDKRRPSPDLEQERTFVQRKTPRGPLSEYGPISSNHHPSDNSPQFSDLERQQLWTMVAVLQQELKKMKIEKMAVKWENDELKVENRRVKMYNDELNKNQVQLVKENDTLKLKQKELFGEFTKKISQLEQENKFLVAGRTLPLIENRLKNTIANLID